MRNESQQFACTLPKLANPNRSHVLLVAHGRDPSEPAWAVVSGVACAGGVIRMTVRNTIPQWDGRSRFGSMTRQRRRFVRWRLPACPAPKRLDHAGCALVAGLHEGGVDPERRQGIQRAPGGPRPCGHRRR
jgi:hypothetical protein